MNFAAPGLGPSIAKGFSSRKAYTRDLNFWANSARSFPIRVWGNRFATSIVKVAQSLLLVSTSKVGFEKFACDASRFRRIRASLISRHLQKPFDGYLYLIDSSSDRATSFFFTLVL
jgi:hypothetical protein